MGQQSPFSWEMEGNFFYSFRLLVYFLLIFQNGRWSGLAPPTGPGVASEGGEVSVLCQDHNQPLLLLSQEQLRHQGYQWILSTQKHFDCEWEFSLSIDSDTILVHIIMIKALFADSEYLHDDTLPATAANALGILLQNNIKCLCNFSLWGLKIEVL